MNPILKAIDACQTQGELASRVGVSQGFISQLARGARPIPPALCRRIEEATGGVVTRQELRPDVFGSEHSAA
jgi:DNA-binding transcriptional regulator YdaS (Cro superfamily)